MTQIEDLVTGKTEMQHPLFFLLRLQHAQLPLRIDTPEEIRLVSVLKAIGLIEADIVPAFDPTSAFVRAQVASVNCITDEGLAELHRWVSDVGPGRRRA